MTTWPLEVISSDPSGNVLIASSANGDLILTASNSQLRLFHRSFHERIGLLELTDEDGLGGGDPLLSAQFEPSGDHLLIGTDSGALMRYAIDPGAAQPFRLVARVQVGAPITSMNLSQDGSTLLLTGAGAARRFQLSAEAISPALRSYPAAEPPEDGGEPELILGAHMTRDGRVLTATRHELRVYRASDHTLLEAHELATPLTGASSVRFAQDGSHAVALGGQKLLRFGVSDGYFEDLSEHRCKQTLQSAIPLADNLLLFWGRESQEMRAPYSTCALFVHSPGDRVDNRSSFANEDVVTLMRGGVAQRGLLAASARSGELLLNIDESTPLARRSHTWNLGVELRHPLSLRTPSQESLQRPQQGAAEVELPALAPGFPLAQDEDDGWVGLARGETIHLARPLTWPEGCGDGVLGPTERWDPGQRWPEEPGPMHCGALCGNGVIDMGERCDGQAGCNDRCEVNR